MFCLTKMVIGNGANSAHTTKRLYKIRCGLSSSKHRHNRWRAIIAYYGPLRATAVCTGVSLHNMYACARGNNSHAQRPATGNDGPSFICCYIGWDAFTNYHTKCASKHYCAEFCAQCTHCPAKSRGGPGALRSGVVHFKSVSITVRTMHSSRLWWAVALAL